VWDFPEYKYQTNGMAVFQLPRGGWTALMFAARQNATAAASMLADLKADMNAQDPDGTTALQLAILNVHYDLATMLLKKGADPNVQDSTGMTALYAAVDMRSPAGMMTRPNPKVDAEIDAAEMIRILLANGANPNLQLKKPIIGRHNNLVGDTSLGEGATPLMRAAKQNDMTVIRFLLDGGADPNLTMKDRTNVAMNSNSLDAIKLFVEHGLDVNAFNSNGLTLAHSAAGRGANAVLQYIAENGARLDKKDKQGRTPLDIASGAGGGGGGGRGARGAGGGRGGPRGGGAPGGGNQATAELLRELIEKSGK
jgi:uncharacterized protein